MEKLKCKCCQELFESKTKSAIYCSRGCSNKGRGFFFSNPSYCEWCKIKITRPCPSKKHRFCSKLCEMDFRRKDRIHKICNICQIQFWTVKSSKKKFCSQKCMGIGMRGCHPQHKRKFRSFGECAMVYLFRKNYPELKIVTNDRKELNGYEMDIWFPDHKIGIEYNGQHHFKPVYGEKVFEKTKHSDMNKSKISEEKSIKLIYIFPIGHNSKSKILNMFVKCTSECGFQTPIELDFSKEDVLSEQGNNRPAGNKFINIGRGWSEERKLKSSLARLKTYYLISPSGEEVKVSNLKEFCSMNKMSYTWALACFNKRKCIKGWKMSILNRL